MSEIRLRAMLDQWADKGRTVDLWLRDDDAIASTSALEELLSLTRGFCVPVTLAVIPEPAGPELASALAGHVHVHVAVHGWSHENHAPMGSKKQELGPHRPGALVIEQLRLGFARLQDLHGRQCLPMLVPPWNRISTELLPSLSSIGFTALSVFGPERPVADLACLNTQVDVMDWRGSRGGRDADALFGEMADHLATREQQTSSDAASIGLLTHHLVHDDAVWRFLQRLFEVTCGHPACRWRSSEAILARRRKIPRSTVGNPGLS